MRDSRTFINALLMFLLGHEGFENLHQCSFDASSGPRGIREPSSMPLPCLFWSIRDSRSLVDAIILYISANARPNFEAYPFPPKSRKNNRIILPKLPCHFLYYIFSLR